MMPLVYLSLGFSSSWYVQNTHTCAYTHLWHSPREISYGENRNLACGSYEIET